VAELLKPESFKFAFLTLLEQVWRLIFLINQNRLKNLLIELIKIDSLSRKERTVALRLQREMESLGAEVWIDDAGEKVGGDTGNVIAHFSGTALGPHLFAFRYMDTVVPGEGVVPILDGDILRTDGRTVLGGDDKSGVAIICEVLRVVKENQIPVVTSTSSLPSARKPASLVRNVST
jgi:tripeptide aminopeptidase